MVIIFGGEFKTWNYGCAFINSRSFLFAKDMIFGKQKIDVKQFEDEHIYV